MRIPKWFGPQKPLVQTPPTGLSDIEKGVMNTGVAAIVTAPDGATNQGKREGAARVEQWPFRRRGRLVAGDERVVETSGEAPQKRVPRVVASGREPQERLPRRSACLLSAARLIQPPTTCQKEGSQLSPTHVHVWIALPNGQTGGRWKGTPLFSVPHLRLHPLHPFSANVDSRDYWCRYPPGCLSG